MRVVMAVHSNYINDARVRREAETLAGEGYRVTVFAAWPGISSSSYVTNGVEVEPIPLNRDSGIKRFAEMMYKMYRHLKAIASTIDIAHLHDADTLLPAILSLPRETPIIYDSHEWYQGSISLVRRPIHKMIWHFIESYSLGRIGYLITVNESIRKLYLQHYQFSGRAISIRNFATRRFTAVSEWQLNSNLERIITNLKKEVKCIAVFSGNLKSGRGLEYYIDAIKKKSSWGLLFAGDGAYRNQLERKITKNQLQHRVKCVGMLPYNHLFALIGRCDVGLCYTDPISENHYYSLPNKITEYVQMGLPVIGSNLPEIAGLIRDYNIGMVAETPSQIENCLELFSQKDKDETNYSTYTPEKVQIELSWENEQHKLVELYQIIQNHI